MLLTLTALMVVGCEHQTDTKIDEAKQLNGFKIVVIDSCEYLKNAVWIGNQVYGYFAHKGNCRFCKERRQKELENYF